jgi:multidrug efflux pump
MSRTIEADFFRQFALTIAVSTAISALNSLTLSPALAALLLKQRGAKKDSFQRIIDGLLGWLFKGFNKTFSWASNAYGNTVARLHPYLERGSAIHLASGSQKSRVREIALV